MKITVLPLVLMGVILNAMAQILLKAGMNRIGEFDFAWNKFFSIGYQAALNPFILSGLFAYVISVVVWLMVLSRVEVSVAYPMISLGYVINAIFAYYLFGESLTIERLTGIFIILLGVYIVARS